MNKIRSADCKETIEATGQSGAACCCFEKTEALRNLKSCIKTALRKMLALIGENKSGNSDWECVGELPANENPSYCQGRETVMLRARAPFSTLAAELFEEGQRDENIPKVGAIHWNRDGGKGRFRKMRTP